MDGIYDLYPLVNSHEVRLIIKKHLVLMCYIQLLLKFMFHLSFCILYPLLLKGMILNASPNPLLEQNSLLGFLPQCNTSRSNVEVCRALASLKNGRER